MAKVKRLSDNSLAWYCPACKHSHCCSDTWTFNGDVDKPTFHPSVLVRSGHYRPQHTGSCWCDYNREHPDDPSSFKCMVCHTWVKEGKIQYLSDCTHELAGQTIEMEEF